ncbi:MAG TPA: hypothetical protein VKE41_09670 [Roseiflexaceae bacterium]|nr:hypothetical protein [Roseiflexaceae bacterium]
MLTGHGSLETALEGLHQGVFDYLLKTTEPGQVIERVKAGLAARAQQLRQRTLLDLVGAAVHELRGVPAGAAEDQGARASARSRSAHSSSTSGARRPHSPAARCH